MKHMKLIFMIITVIIVYFIYILADPDDVTYLALGDSLALGENPYGEIAYGYSDYLSNYLAKNHTLKLYTKKFASKEARIKDVYQDLTLNKKVYVNEKSVNLKSGLRDADIITLSIGAVDIINKMNFVNKANFTEEVEQEIVNNVTKELEQLLKEMKKYNKNIIVVGYYNLYPQKEEYKNIFKKLNNSYRMLVTKEDLIYIDIYNKFPYQETLTNPFSIHPNIKGYEFIYQQIVKNISL